MPILYDGMGEKMRRSFVAWFNKTVEPLDITNNLFVNNKKRVVKKLAFFNSPYNLFGKNVNNP